MTDVLKDKQTKQRFSHVISGTALGVPKRVVRKRADQDDVARDKRATLGKLVGAKSKVRSLSAVDVYHSRTHHSLPAGLSLGQKRRMLANKFKELSGAEQLELREAAKAKDDARQ